MTNKNLVASRKKILITGASGYIGRNLVEHLKSSHYLHTPSHKALDLCDEVSVKNYFKKHVIDIVIHTAVVGGTRKEQYVQNAFMMNMKMFLNIIRCTDMFGRLIHLGSGAEYDKRRPIKKIKESQFDQRVPQDEYGLFKYSCSKYIEHADNILNLRIFGIFGKYEDYRLRFISNAIVCNLFGLPIVMNQNVVFDYLYIADFVKIVEYFIIHKPKEKFYNIASGQSIDLVTIAGKINEIAPKSTPIEIKKKGLNKEYTCDNSRLMKELGNFEITDFDKSLQELYQWYTRIKSSLITE